MDEVGKVSDGDVASDKEALRLRTKTLLHIASERLLLFDHEESNRSKFPRLGLAENINSGVTLRFKAVLNHLGVMQDALPLSPESATSVVFDGFPALALKEMMSVYKRAHGAVVRADFFLAGLEALRDSSAVADDETSGRRAPDRERILKEVEEAFWEQAETAFIRLASYWDRVGQLLNFAFFSIRKFDRDGFKSVMERINDNVVQIRPEMAGSDSWVKVRGFWRLDSEKGYAWLSSRRNLMVHSLHLHPFVAADSGLFESQVNHYEIRHKTKLKPKQPREEVDLLLGQLRVIVDLFPYVLDIVEFSPLRGFPDKFRPISPQTSEEA